jgi:hypothetical protein
MARDFLPVHACSSQSGTWESVGSRLFLFQRTGFMTNSRLLAASSFQRAQPSNCKAIPA